MNAMSTITRETSQQEADRMLDEERAVRRASPLYAKMQAIRLNLLDTELDTAQRNRAVQDGADLREQVAAIAADVGITENELEKLCAADMRASARQPQRAPEPVRRRGGPSITAASRSLGLLDGVIARQQREIDDIEAQRTKTRLLAATAKGAALQRLDLRMMHLTRESSRMRSSLFLKQKRRVDLVKVIEGEGGQ